ncbi:MAG: uroporphyrinogen-III C-methyltransferase [Microbacteriaceae bacterium]|nr:uroporphyrinogen-III C-methyltransferase [Burkholderiaceae bacterium]
MTDTVRVVFIGAGPGAADLITVRGAHRLAQAQAVLFDALTDPALRDLAPTAEWLDVGKRGFGHATGQAAINALLLDAAHRHVRVVRLKGGDPSIFGRLEEELAALRSEGICCEVVPGVSAALAAAAHTQRPLPRRGRGRSGGLTTAMTHLGTLQASRTADTEVFYMAGRQLAALSQKLREAGWPADTPASVVSNAGWPDARCTDHTVATLADATLPHADRPAVVTVGAGALTVGTNAAAATETTEAAYLTAKTPCLERHPIVRRGPAA